MVKFILAAIADYWRQTPLWIKFIYIAMIFSKLLPACLGDALVEAKYEECMAEYQNEWVCNIHR